MILECIFFPLPPTISLVGQTTCVKRTTLQTGYTISTSGRIMPWQASKWKRKIPISHTNFRHFLANLGKKRGRRRSGSACADDGFDLLNSNATATTQAHPQRQGAQGKDAAGLGDDEVHARLKGDVNDAHAADDLA